MNGVVSWSCPFLARHQFDLRSSLSSAAYASGINEFAYAIVGQNQLTSEKMVYTIWEFSFCADLEGSLT